MRFAGSSGRHNPAAELPVVMLTAKDQPSDLLEGLDAGANDYLTKPVSKNELLARVRTHLENVTYYKELKLLNEKLDGLLKEFSRISFKIHNSLKNKLESIRNYVTDSLRFADRRERLIENLSIVDKLVNHCSNESKNILFVLTNKECTINSILEELKLQAELLFAGKTLNYTIETGNLPGERILPPEIVQSVLDLYAEVLNNIVKHSAATRVDVRVGYEKGRMSLLVKDDGVGFDYESEREKRGSYGLKMMEELNLEMNCSISIDSQRGSGTTVTITVGT